MLGALKINCKGDRFSKSPRQKKHPVNDYWLVLPMFIIDIHGNMGADLFWEFFSFFFWHFFFWSVGFVPAFFPAHVVWLGGVLVVVWWCFCGGVFVVVFVW